MSAERARHGLIRTNSRTILRAFSILRAFHSGEEWARISDLSRRANVNETTAQRLINSLKAAGAVMQNDQGCFQRRISIGTR